MSLAPIQHARFVGKEFLHLSAVDSTNTFCLKHPEILETAGMVVYADRQFAGRGRRDRLWDQGDGTHLFASFVIHPQLPPVLVPSLALCAGLAVHHVLADTFGLEDCSLKWPNDVLVSDRKVCGILCESLAVKGNFRIVAGIGINISGGVEQFDPELSRRAATLEMFGVCAERDELLMMLSSSFDAILAEMHRANHAGIFRRWVASSNCVGRRVCFSQDGEMVKGKITGLDDLGRLVVETSGAKKVTVLSGEVEFI